MFELVSDFIANLGVYFFNAIVKLVELTIKEAMNSWIIELMEDAEDLVATALHIEDTLITGLTVTPNRIQNALKAVYMIMIGLLAIKLIWKGYKIYVLERDGDADVSPVHLLINASYAIIVALAFPLIYEITTHLVEIIGNTFILKFQEFSTAESLVLLLNTIFSAGANVALVGLVLLIVFAIDVVRLWFRMIRQGFELLIFRLGVPLAVTGLVDSDGGMWKSYLQLFVRQMITIMIQGFCFKLAIVLAVNFSIQTMMGSIACLSLALKLPQMMSSLVVGGGTGGNAGAAAVRILISAAKFLI